MTGFDLFVPLAVSREQNVRVFLPPFCYVFPVNSPLDHADHLCIMCVLASLRSAGWTACPELVDSFAGIRICRARMLPPHIVVNHRHSPYMANLTSSYLPRIATTLKIVTFVLNIGVAAIFAGFGILAANGHLSLGWSCTPLMVSFSC